jgi:RHS repeat-associated protein
VNDAQLCRVTRGPSPRRTSRIEDTDHLNTPRLIADATGTAVWRWDQQEPFGNTPPDENPSGLGVFENNLRFPGQYADKETGQNYNYLRDCYDPATGRYCQSDPIGLSGGLNTYAYAGGNPISFNDPSGLLNPAVAARSGYALGQALNGALNYTLVATTGLTIGGLIYEAVNSQSAANAISSPIFAPGPVPNSCPAANDPGPDDCLVRQQQLQKEYEFLKGLEVRGILLRDAKIFWNKKAVIHNIVCRRYPVSTFDIGPTGVVK